MADDFEQAEYFALVGAVDDFDQRLITVKGWGVSLSLVSLGFGFQYSAYGFFLIAAVSSLAFWLIEGAIKQFQMRHYVRIREIEVNRYSAAPEPERNASSPRIDWSWDRAHKVLRGKAEMGGQRTGASTWLKSFLSLSVVASSGCSPASHHVPGRYGTIHFRDSPPSDRILPR
jgi:hypothetical protein